MVRRLSSLTKLRLSDEPTATAVTPLETLTTRPASHRHAAMLTMALDRSAIEAHERDLLEYATKMIDAIPQARIIGRAKEKASVVSFVLDGVHPHDIGTILDSEGIAVRAGHHCTQPLMDRYGVPATARASLSLYNTRAEVDALAAGIHKVLKVFSA